MTYHDLDAIYQEKARMLDGIDHVIRPLTPAQLSFRRAEGEWTVAEIVEHLSIVESGMIRLFQGLAERAATRGAVPPAALEIAIDDQYRDSANGKIKTRQQSEPTGSVSAGDSLKTMRSVQDRLADLRPRLEQVDLSSVSFQHPALGNLTIGQWLVFFSVHEERHLRQIASIISSPTFPRP